MLDNQLAALFMMGTFDIRPRIRGTGKILYTQQVRPVPSVEKIINVNYGRYIYFSSDSYAVSDPRL
jgi:hypothetical protein